MMEHPLVSIGLPVFNGEKYIEIAINSLLNQSYRNLELIILDDASTDRTGEICKLYESKDSRIRYYTNKNRLGMIKNFNYVVEFASSDYFMWASHDDFWNSRYLEMCLGKLISNPSAAMCRSRFNICNEEGSIIPMEHPFWLIKPMEYPILDTTCFSSIGERAVSILYSWFMYGVYRMDFLKRTRLFTEIVSPDLVFELEILLLGDIVLVNEELMTWRVFSDPNRTNIRYIKDFSVDEKLKKQYIDSPWTSVFRGFNSVINLSNLGVEEKQKLKELFVNEIANEYGLYSRVIAENGFEDVPEVIREYLKGLFT